MSWETWDNRRVCAWIKDVCEMDPTPWREAGVIGVQLPTLTIETLTDELGLPNLLSKKVLRDIDTLLVSSGQSPSPSPSSSPSRPSRHRRTASDVVAAAAAAANAGGSRAWLGYVVAILAILSHLFWHPSMTKSDPAGTTLPSPVASEAWRSTHTNHIYAVFKP